jgi:tetratricopeptide (TPR) repeat protein
MNLFKRKPKIVEVEIPDPETIQPTTPEEYFNRGMLFYSHQKFERAVDDFQQALKSNSEVVDPHYGLALVYKAMEKNQEAVASFHKVVSLLEEGKLDDKPDRKQMLSRISRSHIASLTGIYRETEE